MAAPSWTGTGGQLPWDAASEGNVAWDFPKQDMSHQSTGRFGMRSPSGPYMQARARDQSAPDRAARGCGGGRDSPGDVARGFQNAEIRFRSGNSEFADRMGTASRGQKPCRRLSSASRNGIIAVHSGRTGEPFDFIHVPCGIV
jgi:hypothetical protein